MPRRLNLQRLGRTNLLAELTLAATTLLVLLPVVWMLLLAIQPEVNVVTPGWHFGFTTQNFRAILSPDEPYFTQVVNSSIIVVGTVTLCLSIGSLSGYSLSQLNWSPRTTLVVLGAAAMITIIPPMALVPGLYVTLNSLGLLGSLLGLIVLNTVFNLPFATVLMKIYFDRVPHELREAALVDGASEWRTFLQVMWPVVAPGAASVAIFVAIMAWNEFLFGLTMTSGGTTSPITVGIAALLQPNAIEFGQLAALGTMVAAPILTIVIIANRYIVAAVTRGAIKG